MVGPNRQLAIINFAFRKLQEQSGNKARKQLLFDLIKRDGDTYEAECIRDALYYLLSATKAYGVGEKSLDKKIDKPITKQYNSIFDLLIEMEQKAAATDQDIRNIQGFIEENAAYADLIRGMLTKTYRVGLTAKTVNEVLGQMAIPAFTCMLANKYFERPQYVEGKSFTLTQKLDGIRCLAVVRRYEAPRLFSRQGQPIYGLHEVEEDLKKIQSRTGKQFVMDGELIISDRQAYPSKIQYKKTIEIVRKDGDKSGITYNVFDMVDIDAFEKQCCEMRYYQRRQRLATYLSVVPDLTNIKLVPQIYSGYDTEEIMKQLDVIRSQDKEGLMINMNDAFYQFGRTSELLKVKVMQDCDLRITDIVEGTGRFAGTTGAIVVDYKGNPLRVGSGMTDDIRAMLWAEPMKYIGRVVTVQYFEETNDKNGTLSLRFPVFKELRQEGKQVSYE